MSTDNDENKMASDSDKQVDCRRANMSRRSVLSSMAAAGAVGTGLGAGTAAAATSHGNLFWELKDVVYDLMPEDPACANNVLVHAEEQFDDSSTVTEVNDSGCDLDTTWNTSSVTIENNCSSTAGEDWLLPWSNIPQDVPNFALHVSIDSFTGGEAIIGLYNDGNNHVEARLSQIDGNITIVEHLGGNTTETQLQGSVPSAPVDVLVTVMGNGIAVNFWEDGWAWEWADWTDTGTDFYNQSYIQDFAPGVGANLEPGDSITFSSEYVLATQQFGYRDPMLVTHKDGAPMVENDQYVYMTFSAGAPDIMYGAQNVHKIDIVNHTTELVGRIHYNTKSGMVFPDYPTKIVYDDDTGEFIAMVSGWVTTNSGPDDNCHLYVTRTTDNILEGLHVLSMSDTNVPGTGVDHVYDASFYYDSNAGAWRACANNSLQRINSIETTDDSLTSGWSVLDYYEPTPGRVVEGGRVRKVNGERVTYFGDEHATDTMQTSDFPQVSSDIQNVSNDADDDRWSSCLPSHPMVIELQDSNNDETRYKMITFGDRLYKDMGCLFSEGELLFFEAQEINSSLEYSTHSFPSGVGASSSSPCSTTALSEGTYKIEAFHSEKAMTVDSASTSDGANVIQETYSGGSHQQWQASQNSDGTWRFENVNSGKAASVKDASTADGASIIQRGYSGAADQKWTVHENSDESIRLINVNSGLVAEIDRASTRDGADVQQWPWNTCGCQRWIFTSV